MNVHLLNPTYRHTIPNYGSTRLSDKSNFGHELANDSEGRSRFASERYHFRRSNPDVKLLDQRDIETGFLRIPKYTRNELPTYGEYLFFLNNIKGSSLYKETLLNLRSFCLGLGFYGSFNGDISNQVHSDYLQLLSIFDDICIGFSPDDDWIAAIECIKDGCLLLSNAYKQLFQNFAVQFVKTLNDNTTLSYFVKSNFSSRAQHFHMALARCLYLLSIIDVDQLIKLDNYFRKLKKYIKDGQLTSPTKLEWMHFNNKLIKIESFLSKIQPETQHEIILKRITKMRAMANKLASQTKDKKLRLLLEQIAEHRTLSTWNILGLGFIHFGGIATIAAVLLFIEFRQQIKDIVETPFHYTLAIIALVSFVTIYIVCALFTLFWSRDK